MTQPQPQSPDETSSDVARLIEESSFGTAGARQLRARTAISTADAIRARAFFAASQSGRAWWQTGQRDSDALRQKAYELDRIGQMEISEILLRLADYHQSAAGQPVAGPEGSPLGQDRTVGNENEPPLCDWSEAAGVLQVAQCEAAMIVADARQRADRIIANAEAYADGQRCRAVSIVSEAHELARAARPGGISSARTAAANLAHTAAIALRGRSEEADGDLRAAERPRRIQKADNTPPADGQLCTLFAVDIAGFTAPHSDDNIRLYVREELYRLLEKAFNGSGIPWAACFHEDRGDGVLIVVPPGIACKGIIDPLPERLRGLIRRHNHVSCEAAGMQLRAAAHIGLVEHDGRGFVSSDINLLFRMLDARPLKRTLTGSGAELALIISDYVYRNVVRRYPSRVSPEAFQPVRFQVKHTRATAWSYLPSMGNEFTRPLYLGENLLPYRMLPPRQAVIPWDGKKLLDGSSDQITDYLGLATGWRAAEQERNAYRSDDQMTLLGRLNYRRGLSNQFPASAHRVVYTEGDIYLTAARVNDPSAVIENTLYWAAASGIDEARYLTAILNSDTLTQLVRPLQARSEPNPRYFDKYIFQLPIPQYDPSNTEHRQLAELAMHAEEAAAALELPPSVSFQAQRRRIMEALAHDGLGGEINNLTSTLLTVASG